jgi:ATP-dependent protease HslVU (ClpYQ) ATPase subunit
MELIADLYLRNVTDINTALDDFKEMHDQVKAEEASLADKLEVHLSFEDSAVDEIIRQAIHTNQKASLLALKVAQRLEYGLNLVKDRSGIDSFVISEEAISDMENYVNKLIKSVYRQECPSGESDIQ